MAGAPTPDPFTARQVQAIARLVDQQLTRVMSMVRLAAASGSARDVRLAKTVKRDDTYPETGDTFAIRFVEAAFTPLTPGSTTMSTEERTAEGDEEGDDDVIAREINGNYVAEGTYVYALWQRGIEDPAEYGEWWIMSGGGGGGENQPAYTETQIPARSGTTPGGPVSVQPLKIEEGELVADGDEVDVYSWVNEASSDPTTIEGGKLYIFIEQDANGVRWFTGQECPA